MPYAAEQDIIDLHGAELLDLLADTDGDGNRDSAAVTQALEDASAVIDSYLSARYALPLSQIPRTLVTLCVDIAIYRLARSPDLLSEDIRQRYEDALKHLSHIAAGKAGLGIAEPESAGSSEMVVMDAQPRRSGRDKLRGW